MAGCASKAWEIQYEHERTFKPTVKCSRQLSGVCARALFWHPAWQHCATGSRAGRSLTRPRVICWR